MTFWVNWKVSTTDDKNTFNDTRMVAINSQVSKKLTPQVSSWFSTTKGVDCEEIKHDKANLTSSGHP